MARWPPRSSCSWDTTLSVKAAYDTLLTAFEANGTVKDSDLTPEMKK
ncbi:MAG: hypothetical protein PUC32_06865 [Oscillospiraceae bacterium]|nr:hypothetical protein [Oscillospiraceae bacterium]